MSLVFSNTSTGKNGIIQEAELECGFNPGDVSGNTELLKIFTSSINLALDDYVALALQASGTWQFDDSNHTTYPIITTNLVANQRDYSFTLDATSGNLVLDIYRVLVANSSGVFSEIYSVDQQTPTNNNSETIAFVDGRNTTGTPYRYDKTANGIFLDPIPSYNYTNGLKILINREASYFLTSDTTKKPGVPGIHHKYLALKAALDYARRKSLANHDRILRDVIAFEGDPARGIVGSIGAYFSKRQKDVRRGMRANVENTR